MHRNSLIILCCALVLGAGAAASLQAELSSQEIARLGADLTPMGAEKAGNTEGTIPAWEGGITTPPAGSTASRRDQTVDTSLPSGVIRPSPVTTTRSLMRGPRPPDHRSTRTADAAAPGLVPAHGRR